MSSIKLTICFESPFWIGLIETEDNGNFRVARHVFGSEPTDPEVAAFIHASWNTLRFTQDLKIEKLGGRRMNHKRMQRAIEKEIAANARRGTKAQQALAEQRETNKEERRISTRARREAEKRERFEQRTDKRKRKKRGH